MSRIITSLAFSVFTLTACQDGEPTTSEPPLSNAMYSAEVEIDGELRVMPIARLKLDGGAVASFFVWNDLSAGYAVIAPDDSAVPVSDELDGLSAAEAFYAMSRGDVEVPPSLLAHHAALAADTTRPAWGDAIAGHARGWYLELPTTSSLAACNNGSFVANYCSSAGFAGVHCFTDAYGDIATVAFGAQQGGTRKFTAAFCIDGGGTTGDLLQYYGWCGGGSATIWVGTHSSPAVGAYTWIAPSGAQPRDWRHTGWDYGHDRDWASRWGSYASCSN